MGPQVPGVNQVLQVFKVNVGVMVLQDTKAAEDLKVRTYFKVGYFTISSNEG